jgi:hypothetical protein
MNGFLTKPVEPERLYKSLLRWLDRDVVTPAARDSAS